MKTVFGSHLYGLNTPNSDTDYKGIYLPTLNELLLHNYKPYINLDSNKEGKNDSNDVDMEWIALPTFIELACKGETIALDMLHSNVCEYDCLQHNSLGHIWVSLQNNRHFFYTKGLKAYVGYLRRQASKYGNKGEKLLLVNSLIERLKQWHPDRVLKDIWSTLPTGKYMDKGFNNDESRDPNIQFWSVLGAKYQETIKVGYCIEQLQKRADKYGKRSKQAADDGGYDWKSISHALRVGYQLLDIYKSGFFSYPLAETKYILAVKQGLYDYEKEVEPELNRILAEIAVLVNESSYPDRVDKVFWDEWLISTYEDVFNLSESY